MIALCLSGGGFRATLFHLGALRRLNELGDLSQSECFSSVSGGSILNGVRATRWNNLAKSEADGVFTNFHRLIADPLRPFCKGNGCDIVPSCCEPPLSRICKQSSLYLQRR